MNPGHWLRLQFPLLGKARTCIEGTCMLLCDLEAVQSSAVIVSTVTRSAGTLPGCVLVWEHSCGPCPDRPTHGTSSERLSHIAWLSSYSNFEKSFRVHFICIKRVPLKRLIYNCLQPLDLLFSWRTELLSFMPGDNKRPGHKDPPCPAVLLTECEVVQYKILQIRFLVQHALKIICFQLKA